MIVLAKRKVLRYHQWVEKYKGRDIDDITLDEHKQYKKQFVEWRKGNITKWH